MSTREKAIDIINQLPEYQLEKVIYFLQGIQIAEDPFYSAENMEELGKRIADIKSGKSVLKEHELIEV